MKNKVFISQKYFDKNNQLSKGLFSGLNRLNEKGIAVYSDISPENEIAMFLRNIENLEINYVNEPDQNVMVILNCDERTVGDLILGFIMELRTAEHKRTTKETDILLKVKLDGSGKANINTGIGFFDHMLEQISRHGNIDLSIDVKGDLHVDEHHTVEDVGIALGETILKALGDKKGITRYGYFLPMDDTIAKCALDLGGRTYLNFKCKFKRESVGEFPTELVEEFFRGLAGGMKANIYLRAKGKNEHHKIEAMFKAFAKSLNMALKFDKRVKDIPTTKGVL